MIIDTIKDLNKFEPRGVDLSLYENFKKTLEKYGGDVGFYQAWKFAKWANGLIDYYTTQRIKAEGYLNDGKVDLETLEAQKSIELGKNVSDGERQAKADPEVVKQKKIINQAQRYVSYLDGLIDKLEKDFYLMKQRHAEGEKEFGRSGEQ